MSELKEPQAQAASGTTERLFVIELSGGRIHSMNVDGTDKRLLATQCRFPDGIVVDVEAGHVYWTNMGVPSHDDGSIERMDLDGGHRVEIIPRGVTFTPKQIHLDKVGGKLYWSDREGMRVMRSNLDGSNVEVLIETGRGEADRKDQSRWCVGITIDAASGKFYWTQKGGDNAGVGKVRRASIEMPEGFGPTDRPDIETLYDGLPEPIDLEFDPGTRTLYWTDRGDPPTGNTVNSANVDNPAPNPNVLVTHLMEGIGLALDLEVGRMFFTDFAGSIYVADLDGRNKRSVLTSQGNLTGVAFARL